MEFLMGFILGAGIASLICLGLCQAFAARLADAMGAL